MPTWLMQKQSLAQVKIHHSIMHHVCEYTEPNSALQSQVHVAEQCRLHVALAVASGAVCSCMLLL